MNPMETHYQTLAENIIRNMEKRQIEGHYCPTAKDAVALASRMVSAKSTVSFGGSMTLSESGMMDELKRRSDLTLYDRNTAASPEEVTEIYHKAFGADFFFMSSNAISVSGELVNTDGTGNRAAALIYGPKHVIILAGMNKVAPDLPSALERVRTLAAPPNSIRLGRNTPCAATGLCSDCQSPDCICANTVITRRSMIPNRIKVILIGETLGY